MSGFTFSSKNLKDLQEFEKIIKRKFGLKGKIYPNSAGVKKTVHQFFTFNKKISTWLFELGVPKGDKVTQKFNIPIWITSSKELSREYLKIAYFCEGSNKENRKILEFK